MFQLRPANQRGHGNYGWLDTWHSFSFNDYYDPQHMAFRVLRVMNEDRVAPGQGFGMHGHRDMEIITYVLSGELEHRDSLGSGEVLRPGELQYMSAGTGIRHSEFNPSATESVHLYQIWIVPEQAGLQPTYAQQAFDPSEKQGRLRVVASADGRDGSIRVRQNVSIYLATLEAGQAIAAPFETGRHGWLQMLRGSAQAGADALAAGDGLAISEEPNVRIEAQEAAEIMLFDLP
ncbi:MAG TPA: pirin family protein [Pirellulales bacterium]|nr:pirin family protein [Pirellulales bacterium]